MQIYKITNTVNGKMYVGQTTKSLTVRFVQHCRKKQRRSCPLLFAAILKYGQNNFTATTLENCDSKEYLNVREKFWIKELDTFGNGYNLTSGGDRVELAEESKAKIAASLRGRPNNRKGIPTGHTPWNKGKPWSEEIKAKMSAIGLARGSQPWMRGRKPSEETRSKMSTAKRGVPAIKLRKPIICINTGKTYNSSIAASEDLGLSRSKICLVLKGKRTHTGGYKFAYI